MIAFLQDRPRTICRTCNCYPCMDGTMCEGNPPADMEIRLTRADDYRYVEFGPPDDPRAGVAPLQEHAEITATDAMRGRE